MKKFMKFCLIVALVLIVLGSVFYLLGENTGGRDRMNELLYQISGGHVQLDLDNTWGIVSGDYDINDVSIFSEDYEIWQGDVEKQKVCQGNITMLELEIGGSVVEIRESDDESVYIEGSNVGKLQAYLEDGTLYVRTVRPSNLADEIRNSRITLYLPADCSLQQLAVSLGAGQLLLKDLKVECIEAEVGAGQLQLENLELASLNISLGAGEVVVKEVAADCLVTEIGMGNLEFTGSIGESAEISCSMGNVSMKLEGEKEDFNYQLNCVAGNIEIGEDRVSGASLERYIDNGADKDINIECSMGNVEVDF